MYGLNTSLQERVDAAVTSCKQLRVQACGHIPTKPYPALPTLEELAEAAKRVSKLAVSRPELMKPVRKPASKPAGIFTPAETDGKSAWSKSLSLKRCGLDLAAKPVIRRSSSSDAALLYFDCSRTSCACAVSLASI